MRYRVGTKTLVLNETQSHRPSHLIRPRLRNLWKLQKRIKSSWKYRIFKGATVQRMISPLVLFIFGSIYSLTLCAGEELRGEHIRQGVKDRPTPLSLRIYR